MSQPEPTSASTASRPADPFAGLHKMSTTAGLGSGEYAAINPLAVAGVVLGVASGLASMILEPILLIIPLAGLFTSVLALIQIRRSNGTQTGKIWAICGLVLSGAFTLLIGGREVLAFTEARGEQAGVADLVQKLTTNIEAENYDAAYLLFSQRFQERVKIDEFRSKLRQMQPHPIHGKLTGFGWNDRLQIDTDQATKVRYARLLLTFIFEKSATLPPLEAILRREADAWKVEDISQLFPTQQAPPAGPMGPGR